MKQVLRKAQRGVVLFVALIVLVAMSLAGIALMRNVDTGTIIAGNLAFRQTATHVADLGVEAARSWLTSTASATLQNDQTGSAYYATFQSNIDLLGNIAAQTDFDWTNNSVTTTGGFAGPSGYTVRYVIHRLCQSSGDPASASCVKTSVSSSSTSTGTKGAATYGSYAITVPTAALYRITVRVQGPRNTLSYIQSTVF